MCQAFAGEQAFIIACELSEERKGFMAALAGKTLCDNPNRKFSEYDKEAWRHGWQCFQEGIVPLGIEDVYRKANGLSDWEQVELLDEFRRTKVIPCKLREFVEKRC